MNNDNFLKRLMRQLLARWKFYLSCMFGGYIALAFVFGGSAKLLRNIHGRPHSLPGFIYGLETPAFIILPILAVVGLVAYQLTKVPKNMDSVYNVEFSDSDVAGSAAFIRSPEKERKFDITSIENTKEQVFGYDMDAFGHQSEKVIAIKEANNLYLNGHKCVVGGSGSRKTTTQIMVDALQAIRRNESIIALDPKGELYGLLKVMLEKRGYDVKSFNLKSSKNSDGIDFLNELRADCTSQTEILTNLEILAESIILNTDGDNPGPTFWRDGAKACLKGAIAYELSRGNHTTFMDVYDDIDKEIKDFVALFDGLSDDSPAKHYVKMVLDKYNTGNIKDAEAMLSGLKTRLNMFADEQTRMLVSNADMVLKNPGIRPTAYFIITPDQHSTMNFMKNMFFSLCFIKLTAFADAQKGKQALPVKVNMLLDEFPSIGHLDDFQGKLNTLRSRNIAITIVCQDLGQLMRNYPDHEWESIVEACDIFTYLGGNDITSTADYMTKRLGTTTVVDTSDRFSGNRYFRKFDKLRPDVTATERNTGRNLRETYEVVLKDINVAISLVKGCKPLEYFKFDYHDHPLAAEIEQISYTDHISSWTKKEFGIPLDIDDREVGECFDDYRMRKEKDPSLTFEKYRELKDKGDLPDIEPSEFNPLGEYMKADGVPDYEKGLSGNPFLRGKASELIEDEMPQRKGDGKAEGEKPKTYMQILKEKKEGKDDSLKKSKSLIDNF